MHVFDSLCLSKWCNIRLSEGYFVAKYKRFPGGIAYLFALQTFQYFLLLYRLTVCSNASNLRTAIRVFQIALRGGRGEGTRSFAGGIFFFFTRVGGEVGWGGRVGNCTKNTFNLSRLL